MLRAMLALPFASFLHCRLLSRSHCLCPPTDWHGLVTLLCKSLWRDGLVPPSVPRLRYQVRRLIPSRSHGFRRANEDIRDFAPALCRWRACLARAFSRRSSLRLSSNSSGVRSAGAMVRITRLWRSSQVRFSFAPRSAAFICRKYSGLRRMLSTSSYDSAVYIPGAQVSMMHFIRLRALGANETTSSNSSRSARPASSSGSSWP
jgi:hypothetical protein